MHAPVPPSLLITAPPLATHRTCAATGSGAIDIALNSVNDTLG